LTLSGHAIPSCTQANSRAHPCLLHFLLVSEPSHSFPTRSPHARPLRQLQVRMLRAPGTPRAGGWRRRSCLLASLHFISPHSTQAKRTSRDCARNSNPSTPHPYSVSGHGHGTKSRLLVLFYSTAPALTPNIWPSIGVFIPYAALAASLHPGCIFVPWFSTPARYILDERTRTGAAPTPILSCARVRARTRR
jgi:hypothetical protein